jgi:outer membrane protein
MKKCCVLMLLLYACQASAQDKFSLRQCVEYALQHNINLQQSELNVKLSAVQMQQTKFAQYPNVNADVNNGVSVGRSIDPTSNTFINQGYYFNGFSVAGNVLVFGWFARKYARQQSELDNKANVEQYKQLQNDISLNVATGYLRVLLAKEQVKINEAQLQTDLQQYSFTKKRVNAGQLPELNSAQLFAQVSADSSNVISSQLEVNSALLDLKALLNMEMNMPFDIVPVNGIASQVFALQNYPSAENIFITAVSKRPAIQANDYKIKSAMKQIDIAKTAQYPSLNLGASIGTNYASTVKSLTGATYK